jgi:hypothetical protein
MYVKKLFAVIWMLLIVSAVAGEKILIRTIDHQDSLEIIEIKLITDNSYYSNYYLDIENELPYTFKLLKDNEILTEESAQASAFTLLDYYPADKLILESENSRLERTLNFCNNNGVCDYCDNADCEMQENELTCDDCAVSSEDGYCNVRDDNICDPDCVHGYEYGEEAVVEGCYEDRFAECNVCDEEQICIGSTSTQAGEICCLGECESAIDYYEDLDLEEEEPIERPNYAWVFIALGIVILLVFGFIFVKQKKLITISLISVIALTSFLFFYSDNEITGYAAQPGDTEIPDEIQKGEKLGFYYLNPSFRAMTEFNLRLYEGLSKNGKEYINEVRECTEHWLNCVDKYIPEGWEKVECTITDKYERQCSFKIDKGYKALVYDVTYEERPLEIKFALYFPLKLPETPLKCSLDNDLDYFTVKDTGTRKYSMCITGDNSNVPIHLVEAFETYPGLKLVGYTPLLLMTQCFVESSGGPEGCLQKISGGMCQVECPDEYPNCHDNTDEGKRQNILAAAKLLNNKIGRIFTLQSRYGLSDSDMIKLTLFAYNRGEGTILGIPNKRDLNSTVDYLKKGRNLNYAMLHSCYEAYDWNVYGSCGGSKDWCCKTVGGLGYAMGTVVEYENLVCPNTERYVVQ